MKYLVMECHLSYAVVLDENGRFLKVANLHYEVGQTVSDIVEMLQPGQQSLSSKKKTHRWLYSLAAIAACLMVIVPSILQMGQTTYGSVYLTINPEVRIDVNRKDFVVGLAGTNEDGKALIEDYSYKKKELDLVMDELVDRAIDMGYLHEGGEITLTLDADDNDWVVSRSDALSSQLNKHLTEKLSVTITVTDTSSDNHEVTIPVEPGESDYGNSDYGPSGSETPSSGTSDTGTSDTGTSNHDAPAPDVSDYGASNYGDGDDDNDDDD